jgi:hypothetical protein
MLETVGDGRSGSAALIALIVSSLAVEMLVIAVHELVV